MQTYDSLSKKDDMAKLLTPVIKDTATRNIWRKLHRRPVLIRSENDCPRILWEEES